MYYPVYKVRNTNIKLAAIILVDKFNNKSYTKPISNFIDNFTDNSKLDSNFSLISSKLGSKATPTPLF